MVKSLQTFQSFQSLSAQRLQRFATIYNACNDLQRPKRLQRKKAPENRKAFVNICAILLILYLTPGKVHYAASCMLHLVSRILYPASCILHLVSRIPHQKLNAPAKPKILGLFSLIPFIKENRISIFLCFLPTPSRIPALAAGPKLLDE